METVEIRVRLQPRARSNEIVGERDGVLVARVTEPPIEGRANQALRKLIARKLRVGVSRVDIARGAGSREKLVRIEGVGADAVETLLKAGA
jgi:uncharacterized protein